MLCLPLASLSQEGDSTLVNPKPNIQTLQHKCGDHLDTLQINIDSQLLIWLEIMEGLGIKEVDSLEIKEWK